MVTRTFGAIEFNIPESSPGSGTAALGAGSSNGVSWSSVGGFFPFDAVVDFDTAIKSIVTVEDTYGNPEVIEDEAINPDVYDPAVSQGHSIDGLPTSAVARYQVTDAGGNVLGNAYLVIADGDGDPNDGVNAAQGTPLHNDYDVSDRWFFTFDDTIDTSSGSVNLNLVPDASDGSFDYSSVICFTRGTMIKTRSGYTAIEDLSVNDEIWTLDNGFQRIRWIGSNNLTEADLRYKPKLLPIRIKAGALGVNAPEKDLIVSPQHRILVRSEIAKRIFGTEEVLVPANKLLTIDGVDIEWDCDGVEYWHFLFDDHQIVWSNGAPTESLFTGPEALKAVSPEAREEIVSLFPEISLPGYVSEPARKIPERGKDMKRLAQRHQKNRRPVYEVQ